MSVGLKRLVPTDNWELIGEYNNGQYRILDAKDIYDKGFKFLAYPNQLKAFDIGQDISWKNGARLSFEEYDTFSKETELGQVKDKSLRVSYKNQAPTQKHSRHHVYGVFLYPFNAQEPFSLSESIGGGVADLGYSKQYSVYELKLGQWQEFFRLSGCEWAIPIVESTDQSELLIDQIVREVCERSEFNKTA